MFSSGLGATAQQKLKKMAADERRVNRVGLNFSCFAIFMLLFSNAIVIFGEKKLRMVNLVYRHGDRAPVHSFPTDPHKNYWPQGFGQLTQEGMRQEYRLGKFLWGRYMKTHKLLNESYLRSEVYCRSSDKDRTMMSAETQLAGLYTPSGRQRWNSSFPWQPIPVHMIEHNKDFLLRPWDSCPKYKLEVAEERQKDEEYAEMEEKHKGFLEWISSVAGASMTVSNVWMVHDTLFCEKAHGLPLPKWVNDTVLQRLQQIAQFEFNFSFHSETLARLSGGPLLGEMIQHMTSFKKGDEDLKKMYIYSAHDTTVTALLSALKVYNKIMPAYSSVAMVELFSDDKQTPSELTVEIWYRFGQNNTATRLKLKDCDYQCPLDQFIKQTASAIPGNINAACGLNETICVKNVIYKGFVAAVAIVVLILLLLLVWLCVKRCRRPTRIRKFDLVDEHGGTNQLLGNDYDDD